MSFPSKIDQNKQGFPKFELCCFDSYGFPKTNICINKVHYTLQSSWGIGKQYPKATSPKTGFTQKQPELIAQT